MASSFAPAARPVGSQTLMREAPAPTTTTIAPAPQGVLHLRGAVEDSEEVDEEGATRRRIRWAEDVVDNEGMGKKKSKVCCIYHPPRGVDESSDESSSDSDDSDSDAGDDGAARPARKSGGGRGNHNHDHDHDHGHAHGKGKGKGKGRARSPNAYEKVPKNKTGGAKDKG